MTTEDRNQSDQMLLERSIGGDKGAFDDLFARYGAKLYAVAFSITRNHEQAEEAVSEALIRFYRTRESFRSDSKLVTWLHRIVSNSAIDVLRKGNRRRALSLDQLVEANTDLDVKSLFASHDETDDEAFNEYVGARTKVAANRLSDEARYLVLSIHLDGKSYEQLADELHVPVGTVKSRLFRARRLLQDKLPPLSRIHDDWFDSFGSKVPAFPSRQVNVSAISPSNRAQQSVGNSDIVLN